MSAQFVSSVPRSFIAADPRADGAIRHVSFEKDRVVIARRLDGMAMRLGIPCSSFRGVVLALTGGLDAPRFVIRLDHADPELSIVVHDVEDDADVVAEWHAWAALTKLPKFLEREPGLLECGERHLGTLVLGPAPHMRRRGAIVLRRRPRFLTRRKTGERKRMRNIHKGQEIIARH
ncbi:MAG: hypothetical protein JWL62_262 [Hyphomicrobiales bacterium]|nr:hypothetical protein [Hyphomicrobiales bacterium]